jgi:methylase of polypeptide subunit release factors
MWMTLLDTPPSATRLQGGNDALLELLKQLEARDYTFITPTPASHARILARASRREARDVRDILGWSLPFAPEIVDPALLKTLLAADALTTLADGQLKSRYRVSSLDSRLFLHSAYPTDAEDAVFFGPDSYRFATLIRQELMQCPRLDGAHLVDIGAGAGVGGIIAAGMCPDLRITMTDINPRALDLARINARAAAIEVDYLLGTNLDPVEEPIDIALANPPYIIDSAGRDYRNGGDMHGARAALDMAVAAVERLAVGGRFILYTGSPIIAGEDRLRQALTELAADRGCALRCREIDPDVFGEELAKAEYAEVERIAVVAAVISKTD